ncbi:uncharacterized protein TNCV_3406981 [Trichonephila clavipes]|nr:uncharacterized protein TNCV_3406981 [Trichonephila clavipes]
MWWSFWKIWIITYYEIPTQLACAYLKGHLTGRALDWFEVLGYRVVEDKATDYAHLKQALSEQFPGVRNRSELETRFYSSSQKHNQKPSDSMYDLLKIHKILKLEMTEEKLIDHIISRNRQENWRETRGNNRYADNSRPRREFNIFEGQALSDTGAEKSFISEEVYRKYFSYRPRQKTKDRVVTAQGVPVLPLRSGRITDSDTRIPENLGISHS